MHRTIKNGISATIITLIGFLGEKNVPILKTLDRSNCNIIIRLFKAGQQDSGQLEAGCPQWVRKERIIFIGTRHSPWELLQQRVNASAKNIVQQVYIPK